MSNRIGKGLAALGVAAALVAGASAVSTPAYAAQAYDDVMLGVFTNSAQDSTDTFYLSANGRDFQKLSTSFVDKTPGDPNKGEATASYAGGRSWPVFTQACPSIIWYKNTFWVLSNVNSLQGGKVQLIFSASKDLVHWSDPQSVYVPMPGGAPGSDVVAADWAVNPANNTPYVVFSVGYYGDYHGQPERDNMRPYIAQLNMDVKAGFNPAADPKRNDASVLPVSAQGAQAINLSNVDRIDGSLYFEGGQTYLAIKRQGRFNEIWRAAAPGGNGWTLVNNNLAVGSEAPSIAKLNGVYYLYTDDISTDPSHNGANGTRFSSSTSLYSAFTARQVINAVRPNGSSLTVLNHGANAWKQNGPRHGTVITLTDPAAKKIVWDLYKSQFKTDKTSSFTDVAWNHWAVNQGWLEYAVKNNLMTGYKTNGKLNGAFGPEDTLTRGQVATVLYRIATGKDSGDGSTGFKDQGAFPYYRTAIKWLKDKGISTGDKDPKTQKPLNTFRPDAPITRQELATLVYRFAKQQGVKTGTVSTASLNKFKDGGAVLLYAREAMAWANGAGVITGGQGADAGKVMPGNNATRAQAAKIFSVTYRDVLKK